MTSDDASNVSRQQIQQLTFNSGQTYVSGNKTIINFNQALDCNNYNVSGNLIWMIEATGNIILGNISANEWNYYRVLNIKESEQDQGTYEIEGLEYNLDKFLQIDSGFNFETVSNQPYIVPIGPSNLQAYSQYITANSQEIFYSFLPPSSISGVVGYQTFIKTSPFVVGDTTNISLVAANLSPSSNSGTYLPLSNGSYYIRVYSVGQQNVLSSTYAGNDSNPVVISNINPLKDIVISSLQLSTGDFSLNSPGLEGSGIYSTDSPTFQWNVGFPNNLSLENINYRITIRAPSYNYVPSNEIYYQSTGYQTQTDIYTFSFVNNFNSISNLNSKGPFRNFDIVVEATDNFGNSSAGGNYITNGDSAYNNTFGYDIFYATNPQTPAINLYTGVTSSQFYKTGYATQQSITADGDIRIYFTIAGQSANLPIFFNDDVVGGTLYYCGQPFTASEAKGLIPITPIGKVINSTQFTNNINPAIIPANLAGSGQQYIAIAGYDNFDVSLNNDYPSYLTTGLNISNIIKVVNTSAPTAAYYSAWALVEIGQVAGQAIQILNTWQTNCFNIAGIQSAGQGITVTFATPLSSSNYTIQLSSYPYISNTNSFFAVASYSNVSVPPMSLGPYNANNITLYPSVDSNNHWQLPSITIPTKQGSTQLVIGTLRCFIGVLVATPP